MTKWKPVLDLYDLERIKQRLPKSMKVVTEWIDGSLHYKVVKCQQRKPKHRVRQTRY